MDIDWPLLVFARGGHCTHDQRAHVDWAQVEVAVT